MSSALKLEPRCPEPARFTATSAFSRQTSAISASSASGSPSAARMRSMLSFPTNASGATARDGNGRVSSATTRAAKRRLQVFAF